MVYFECMFYLKFSPVCIYRLSKHTETLRIFQNRAECEYALFELRVRTTHVQTAVYGRSPEAYTEKSLPCMLK